MSTGRFTCNHCTAEFSNTAAFGRHLHAVNNRSRTVAELCGYTSTTLHQNSQEEDLITEPDELSYEAEINVNVADETFNFYNRLGDTSEPLFGSLPDAKLSIAELSTHARRLLRFCCDEHYSEGDISKLYEFTAGEANDCACAASLRKHFPSCSRFVSYVERTRKKFVSSEGWRRASIQTATGKNTSGVFRSILGVIATEVEAAGGCSAIIQYEETCENRRRMYSSPIDSDSMREYCESVRFNAPIIAFDLYADATTLSKSGSQSACILRARLVNVRGRSTKWHEIGIAPVLSANISSSATKLAFERALLQQRFLFIALKDAFAASKSGLDLHGELYFLRINTIVCDQPQERSFLSLKAVGSFMDCTLCLMPSTKFSNDHTIDTNAAPQEVRDLNEIDDVYQIQTSSHESKPRNVVNTISRQIIAVQSMLTSEHGFKESQLRFTREETLLSKWYLKRVSATHIPTCFAAFYGLGTKPFRLYKTVGFDKLHVVDLGIERLLPDMAFQRFALPAYNRGVISKAALVRAANQRFSDLTRQFGINVHPFRTNANDVHSSMTGLLRRTITPFLWVSLLGLQPEAKPNDDVLLRAALLVDKFQYEWRGINQPWSTRKRTDERIKKIQEIAFEAGLVTSQALSLRINTKLHRIMRHAVDHLKSYGCSRRGDTDENECLHKTTKSAYHATNKRIVQVADQLLTVRSIAGSGALDDNDDETDTAALLVQGFRNESALDFMAQNVITVAEEQSGNIIEAVGERNEIQDYNASTAMNELSDIL
eukprot:IDg1347t1